MADTRWNSRFTLDWAEAMNLSTWGMSRCFESTTQRTCVMVRTAPGRERCGRASNGALNR